MPDQIRVVYFQRKPYPFHKSLEYIFNDVRSRMPAYITNITRIFSEYSKGIIPRIKIILEAKNNQADVNHVTGDIHFAALLLDRRRTMLTVLDCGILNDFTGIKRAILKCFWFTLPLRKCSVVTVISEATGEELRRYTGYPADRIKVIPVAISPLYTFQAKTFDTEKPEILLVGTTHNKNVLRLIEAVKDIPCRLNIIGRLTEEISVKLSEHSVDFTNAFDLTAEQIVEQYRKCDMLSFVSTYEGFGMPIVEANAVGRPVITSNILSMPEVAGDAACMINPLEVSEIKAGILRIIQDQDYREMLVRKGLENCKRFDPQNIANQYLKVYTDLYSGRYA
jgi:glycosyltransferase involved in cell wall biosynthesis